MSASIPATCISITPNLNRRMVQKECEVFETSGRRPANLQTLYEALLTIQPTFVEAERAFSACGLFVTKLRSRLDDSTIDALCLKKECVAETVNIKSARFFHIRSYCTCAYVYNKTVP